MARRFLKPFYVDNELITNIEQLKEVLRSKPEKLVFSIQDGSLKEFLLGINTEYAEIISEDNIENSLKQLSEKLGIENFRFVSQAINKENKKYLTNEKDIISKIKTEDEIIIGKGHFHLGSIKIDRPIKIKGQGVNFTILEFDELEIAYEGVIFENLFVKGNDYDCPNNFTPIFKSTQIEFKNIFDKVIIGSKDKRKKWEILENTIQNFDEVMDEIKNNLNQYEKSISKNLKKHVVNAFKNCIEVVEVPKEEKSYWFTPYYKIFFNNKKFWENINSKGGFVTTLNEFINYIKDYLNPKLEKNYQFKFNINFVILKPVDLIENILEGWYRNLGNFYKYTNGNNVYFDEESDAHYRIRNDIFVRLDSLIDKELNCILTKNLFEANKSGIEQIRNFFKQKYDNIK